MFTIVLNEKFSHEINKMESVFEDVILHSHIPENYCSNLMPLQLSESRGAVNFLFCIICIGCYFHICGPVVPLVCSKDKTQLVSYICLLDIMII